LTFLPRFPPDELVEIKGVSYLLRTEHLHTQFVRDGRGHLVTDAAGEAVLEVTYRVYHTRATKATHQGS
jgi:hypothetical protein